VIKTSPQAILTLIRESRTSPEIRGLALGILKSKKINRKNYPKVIKTIAEWVHSKVKFRKDPKGKDILYPPLEALRLGEVYGVDCEDFTTLTGSLLESLGVPVKVVIVSKTGRIWDHVFLRAGYPPKNPKRWISVDTTITPPWGREIPYVKERILQVNEVFLGSPGQDIIDLIERMVAPDIVKEVNQSFKPYEVSWLRSYAERLGSVSKRPQLPYRAFAVPGDVVNAFSIPGGNIYVYEGLLRRFGKDVVAGVVGHEIAHTARRHCINSYIGQYGIEFISGLINQGKGKEIAKEILTIVKRGYGREAEFEADRYSVHYNQRAGLYPFGIKKFLEWLVTVEERPVDEIKSAIYNLLATHPPAGERLRKVQGEIERLGIVEVPKVPAMLWWLVPLGVGGVVLTGVILSRR